MTTFWNTREENQWKNWMKRDNEIQNNNTLKAKNSIGDPNLVIDKRNEIKENIQKIVIWKKKIPWKLTCGNK